tara:strand:- start:71 stop:562 length:492 start_codon:yes stop_codon:yes gene_type:complete
MKELSKQRIQQMWDYELINLWDEMGKNKMSKVVSNFVKRIRPERSDSYSEVGIRDVIDFLSSLGLKRCLDVDHKQGFTDFFPLNTDVIGFIHGRCEKLSMDLINGGVKPLILMDIDNYNWKRVDLHRNDRTTRKRRRVKLNAKAEITVRSRDLSKKHDWTTEK